MVDRQSLDCKAGCAAQMKKGGGISTTRKRNTNRNSGRKAVPDQCDQPVIQAYWHPKPCIATVDCVAAMLPGKRVPTSARVTQASGT